MGKNKETVVPFALIGISTEEFATLKSNYNSDEDELQIGLDIEVRTNPNSHAVGIFTRFEFIQKSQPIMVIQCACHFSLDTTYWDSQIEGESITLTKSLLTHLLVLTVGTARGIIHAKKPTWMEGVLLPTFNVSDYIKEDMIFSLQSDQEE